jgi:hypothetical protein
MTGPTTPGPAGVPATPARTERAAAALGPSVTIATFPDYALAQRVVDYLSDHDFPVEHTAIIGTDLRLVERVLGRLTIARAGLAGAASGAWFGLLIGLLIALFASTSWGLVILVAILIGAAWGAVFGAMAHALTGGRRDFASTSRLEASQYAVTVHAEHADQARQLLTRLNWQSAGAGGDAESTSG